MDSPFKSLRCRARALAARSVRGSASVVAGSRARRVAVVVVNRRVLFVGDGAPVVVWARALDFRAVLQAEQVDIRGTAVGACAGQGAQMPDILRVNQLAISSSD